MKEQAFGRDTVVLLIMAFGFGALFAWGLSTPPPAKLGPATPIDWPAWVQAVGSVLAICAAVLIARWQRISERIDAQRREALSARSLGAVLLRDIKRFHNSLVRCIAKFTNETQGAIGLPINLIPDELWERVADIHKLGEPGSHLLRAIFQQQEAREFVSNAILLPKDQDAYLKHMRASIKSCEAAIGGIRAMAE